MDLSYTPEEEAFRAHVRAWIAAHKPAEAERHDMGALKAWQRRLHEAGFLGSAWPREHGGGGLSGMEQAILNEEMARAHAPAPIGQMGIWWVGPAILQYGSEEQKRRFVARILSADDIWATGYSEPNAGSDMFNTQTRAVRCGAEYVINGQKVWTTQAHQASWLFLLVRTSSEGHKVAGLSVMLVPMDAPGIEVRPIRQITGDSEFNEVFLRDVRVPQSALLGSDGQGYEIVSSALVNERTGIASGIRFEQTLEKLIETARERGVSADPVWRQRIAALAIKTKIMNVAGLRALSDQLHGRFNPHLSAAMKCISTTLTQQLSEAGIEMQGPYGLLWKDPHERRPGETHWAYRFLYDRMMTIAGGTSEIQRNIVAERLLGLPRR
jgi:alkylation response protein AidB-like acyl-CoA dehydrogenase